MQARTALLVDDRATETLRELVPWRQVKLEATANLDEAIDCLKQHSYCGVVLNLNLAERRAKEILQHISGIPIVLISTSVPKWLHDLPNVGDIKLVMTPPFEISLLASMILGLCGIER